MLPHPDSRRTAFDARLTAVLHRMPRPIHATLSNARTAGRVASLRANNGNGSIHVKKRTIDSNVCFSIRFIRADTICLCLIYTIYVRKRIQIPILLILFTIIHNMQASDNSSAAQKLHVHARVRGTTETGAQETRKRESKREANTR